MLCEQSHDIARPLDIDSLGRRRLASVPDAIPSEDISEKDYHRIADLTLGELMGSLETLIDEIPDISDPDLEYSQVISRRIHRL